jgi:hypothetical protein
MAETRRSTESEQHRRTGADPHDRVEVFDANANANANTIGSTQRETVNGMESDPGFGNADLHNARVVTGNGEPTTFRPTDLRDTELNTTTAGIGNNTGSDIGAAGQGTNWGTILMVIAIILVIILLGSWLF